MLRIKLQNYSTETYNKCLTIIKKHNKDLAAFRKFFKLWDSTQLKYPISRTKRYAKLSRGVKPYNLLIKYGKDESIKRWKKYCNIQAYTNSYEYKRDKYGWDYTKFKEYNLSRSTTLDNMQSRYGEIEGKIRFENYRNEQKTLGCSLEYFQSKLGESKGLIKYREINKRKGTSWNNREMTNYSKISQELFNILDKEFPGHSYFASKNKEFCIRTKQDNYFLDYTHYDLMKVIEFNGDLWHANPLRYNKDDLHYFGKTSSEIWRYDEKKIENIINRGFQVLIIWESDYRKDANKVINECREFLSN